MAELLSPKDGMVMDNLDYKKDADIHYKYAISKAGMVLHAKQYAKLYKDNRIVSVVRPPTPSRYPVLTPRSL